MKRMNTRTDVRCRACKKPVAYDPGSGWRAIEPGSQPPLYWVVCSEACRGVVQSGGVK